MTQKEIEGIRVSFPETKPVAFNYMKAREIVFDLLKRINSEKGENDDNDSY